MNFSTTLNLLDPVMIVMQYQVGEVENDVKAKRSQNIMAILVQMQIWRKEKVKGRQCGYL